VPITEEEETVHLKKTKYVKEAYHMDNSEELLWDSSLFFTNTGSRQIQLK
jgi:hypothetical protein